MSSERSRRMITVRRAASLPLAVILLLSAAALAPRKASAIPAFARKYETSCQTCHVVAPALTPFGEAFRQNGYRFPEGQDPAMTKSAPIPLGAEGYKKLWPQAVWPGEIPGMPPVAVLYTSTVDYDRATRTTTFAGMGGELEILGAGTLDEHLSFWGSVVFGRDGDAIATEMERVNLLVRPLASTALMFKVGSFEPGLMLVSTHRSIMDQELMALTEPGGDNPWTPEPFQQGFEAYGTVQHRLQYNAGLVEGSGSVGDKSKDTYGRLAWKWGGLAFDGASAGSTGGTSNPKPWSEKSIAVSGFAYHGTGLLINDAGPGPKEAFNEFGGDVALNWLDLSAHAGYSDRKDKHLLMDDAGGYDAAGDNAHVKNTFAEAYWVAYPWLVPAARMEWHRVIDQTTEQASLTVNGLVRANVKTFLAANWVKAPGGKFQSEGATLGALIGF